MGRVGARVCERSGSASASLYSEPFWPPACVGGHFCGWLGRADCWDVRLLGPSGPSGRVARHASDDASALAGPRRLGGYERLELVNGWLELTFLNLTNPQVDASMKWRLCTNRSNLPFVYTQIVHKFMAPNRRALNAAQMAARRGRSLSAVGHSIRAMAMFMYCRNADQSRGGSTPA